MLVRDDFAKAFVFEHKKMFNIKGENENDVWDNFREYSIAYNHFSAIDAENHLGSAEQWTNFWLGDQSYSMLSLLKVALTDEEFKKVQNQLDECNKVEKKDSCMISVLKEKVFTGDALGGTSIWYMKMRRMENDDLAGVHNNMYYSFQGDAVRESFFAFGK